MALVVAWGLQGMASTHTHTHTRTHTHTHTHTQWIFLFSRLDSSESCEKAIMALNGTQLPGKRSC